MDLDPAHPNGTYALDLADPKHRQVRPWLAGWPMGRTRLPASCHDGSCAGLVCGHAHSCDSSSFSDRANSVFGGLWEDMQHGKAG